MNSRHVSQTDTQSTQVQRVIRRSARAFSLLELSLVLLIMGLLMGVAAYNLMGAGNRAKGRTTQATMVIVKGAIMTYQLHENTYPVDLDALVKGKNPYLEDKKNADGWGMALRYAVPGRDGHPFSLVSAGEDQQFGTEDDLDIWLLDKK